jgi:nucleoside-diphosphate-sugar epimerase
MRPTTRKGALRVEAEEHLRDASADGVRTIILRAGDFYGGTGTGSWFDRVMVQYIGRGRLIYPGPLDVMHEWAYLPDLAATLPRLCAVRARLEPFATFGFSGHAVTGREMTRAIMRAARRNMRVDKMPWWLLNALAPLVPTFRELTEMAYLWQKPHRISGERLRAAIGEQPHTPLEAAVAEALHDLGRE